MRKIIGSLLSLGIIIVLLASKVVAGESEFPITFRISAPSVVRSGDKVKVYVDIENNMKYPLTISLERSGELAEVTTNIKVIGPDKVMAPETEYGLEIHGKKPGAGTYDARWTNVDIQPGTIFRQFSIISNAYDMTRVGRYVVQAERYSLDGKTRIISNRIVIDVKSKTLH
jgi:nitrous oxide reductase